MFYTQKGFLPRLAVVLGIIIPAVFFARIAMYSIPMYLKLIDAREFSIILGEGIKYFVLSILYLVIPVYVGVFLSGLFPLIRLSKRGVEYKYFGGIIKKIILWSEVEAVKKLNNGYWAILINRRGFPLFNGLYMNEFYGRLMRCGYPVILLSPYGDDFRKILHEMEMKTNKII